MTIRCAIHTRKSSEEGLAQAFNSLSAQRELCEAYIHSQKAEGWRRCAATAQPACRKCLVKNAVRSASECFDRVPFYSG